MNDANKNIKVAKGYRLKPETHDLIIVIQGMINGDKDKAINTACTKFITDSKLLNKNIKQKEK